ncbi:MAG TPA: M28 family metallopeptidase [Candidatus Polarisedimenticolia bacterium]|nr:M28 family metallopeptidase [Candidatus Polarisedimenticolia bacterium]
MHRPHALIAVLLAAVLLPVGCAGGRQSLDEALSTINADDIASRIKTLSSDDFQGRAPSSPGEEKTVNYLASEFRMLGLQPGNGDSYFQEVPLVALTADPAMTLAVRGRGHEERFKYGDQFMAWTLRVAPESSIDASQMVFVGYGIVAPEYQWNDYQGLDVHGKTVVMLVNDPGFATKDPALFKGNAMTYYGRWTYKYEEAARQGAAGAFIVHETEPAAYPWDVVRGSWSGEKFQLETEDDNRSRAAVEGWLTLDSARAVFRQAGLDYEDLKGRAARRGFTAVPMGLKASLAIHNTIRRSTSRNVVAVRPGGERADEAIIYMAHWDHLGQDPSLKGDTIYNGAVDNASGVATLLALARAFESLPQPPQRSVLFLATTAEEQGLLGSEYYAAHPIVPLDHTIAVINIDGVDIWGPMKDITIVGYGNSDLDDLLAAAAKAQGRVVRPDPEPEKGHFYRSDHFTLAKKGVPALYTDAGIDSIEHGEAWGRKMRDAYTAERYHKPSDEYDASWDLSGAVQDARLLFRVGYRLVSDGAYPDWKPGTEFKATRDAMMAARK